MMGVVIVGFPESVVDDREQRFVFATDPAGKARQREDALRWQTSDWGARDSCQRCPRRYGEPSPNCANFRQHGKRK